MVIPSNMTEAQVLAIMDNVANRLASRFKFGYNSVEDMKQEARMFCIEAMPRYDGERPLENFLYIHAHNRLYNLKRNKYMRLDKPCLDCPLSAYDPHCAKSNSQCTEFEDKEDCELYAAWFKRTSSKHNLMYPKEISSIDDSQEKNMRIDGKPIEDVLDEEEVFRIIDKYLSIELRPYYIKMKNGSRVPKKMRELVNAAVLEIINDGTKT